MSNQFQIGDRVVAKDGSESVCLIKYIGEVEGTSGIWIGVEWDDPNRGKHDGSHQGKKYFPTLYPKSGSFVREHKLHKGILLGEAVQSKYGFVQEANAGVNEDDMKKLCVEINAPFLQMVGFDKVNRQQSNYQNLRNISLKNSKIYALEKNVGEWLPNIKELDLSDNLLNSWNTILDVGNEFPNLISLDVSNNHLSPIEDYSQMNQCFSNLKKLFIHNMNYEWNEIIIIAENLFQLEVLHLQENRIQEIAELKNDVFKNLKELDISCNALKSWNNVMKFSKLSNLEILNLNSCQIKEIEFPNDNENYFPSLKYLKLSENNIDKWESIGQLHRIPITDFRIRSNPILETHKGETCRQIIIASIPTVNVVNGTEVFKTERYGAELDYRKIFAEEYLEIIKEGKDLNIFYTRFPRYKHLIDVFGPPEEYELKKLDTNIKSSLFTLTIDCPLVDGFKKLNKKIPQSITIHKLRSLLQRLVKAKGEELEISYQSAQDPEVEVKLDNDLRELNFYSIANGDTILVKWN